MMLFYGPAYEAAVPPLQVLAGGSLFVFCTWILHSAAIAMNLESSASTASSNLGMMQTVAVVEKR